ncbi:mesenchyme-specific cell surface glycoprotein-like [Mytilus trossulus]|uniref:mesenchyme-specific cell surface glycoprotein-like n=1 Tax=Mytilus trossulus TaxID=6551 RepID=UPI003006263F
MKTLVQLLLFTSVVHSQFQLNKLSYFKFPYTTNNNYGFLKDAAHKAAYDSQERIMYVIGSQSGVSQPRLLHVIDISNPSAPNNLYTHSFDAIDNGRANDVAVCGDTVAVSLESSLATKEGHVTLFKTFQRGNVQLVSFGREQVGVDPKGLAFTSDCQKLIIANEGRGDLDEIAQSFVDPPGTVTIMLRNDVGSPAVVTISFDLFLAGRETEYQNKGVRWVYRGNHNAGIINKMSDDLEPEQVTISKDQRFAYVSLPENNAVARIDINAYNVNEIFPLGEKNWQYYGIDCSDQHGGGKLSNFPVYSMRQATDIEIATFSGMEVILTAEQGMIKRYTAAQGDEFDESKRARTIAEDDEFDESDISWTADLKAAVRDNQRLGRWQVRYSDAPRSALGSIETVQGYGGRGISVHQTQTFSRLYDTEDELERKEFENYASTFNGEASNGGFSPLQQIDLRSDDHGPEPTAIAVGMYDTTPMVVVGTKTGLIHVYRDVNVALRHESVHREGQITQPWNTLYTTNQTGDSVITDIGIINQAQSPNGKVLVWAIGSASGSLGIYELQFVNN